MYRHSLRVFFLLVLFASQEASSQDFRFRFENASLTSAVERLKAETGVDVVYSTDVIGDFTSSCSYFGSDIVEALQCIIGDAPIEIRAISERQYVLVLIELEEPTERRRRGSISGFILDATSGESLYGATVYLPDLRAGTISNEAGFFSLPRIPAGNHRVRFSFLGYVVSDTTLSTTESPFVVEMERSLVVLDRVVVESTSLERSDLALFPGVISVPVRRLEQLPTSFGGKDLFEVFGWMPGIQRAGEVNGGLIVRGSGPDQNLYMIDGAPVYHPWHAFSLISTFQTETFKDLKFYRGAFPAEHGGRLSSVLDAELRDGRNADPKLIAAINTLNARFLIESALGSKSSFMLSGRRSYIDKLIGRQHPVSDDAGRRDTLRTGYFYYDWSAKISFAPKTNTRLSFSYYTGRDDLDLRLPFDLSLDFSSWLRPADLFFEVDQDWGNRLYSFRYQHLVSDRLFLTGTAYHSEYGANEAALIRPTQSSSVTSSYAVHLQDLGFRLDADLFPSLTHQVRAGISLVNHRFSSDINALVSYSPSLNETLEQRGTVETTEFAVYAQDHWKPTDRLSILIGTRLSYFGSGRHLRLSPRLSYQYIIDPRWMILRGSVTTQYQYLQRIRDRFSFLYDLVSSRWIPSSSSVEPSRSNQVSLGSESLPYPWLKLTAEGYFRLGENVILPRDEFQSKNGLLGPGIDISTLLGQYTRGNQRSYGVELGADLYLGDWQILFAYTGSQSENRTPDLSNAEYRPSRFDVPKSLSTVVQRRAGRWQFTLSTLLRSGYPLTVPIARYDLTDPVTGESHRYFHMPEINNGRLPPYFRMDFGVGIRFGFANADWTAQIHIYNIFNKRNVINRTYDPSREQFVPNNSLGLPFLPLFELEMQL